MKKNLLSAAGLFLAGLLITGCSEGIEKKIAVADGGAYIVVSIPKDSSANYINVYRGVAESKTAEDGTVTYDDPSSYVKIGQINSSTTDGMISYAFKDYLIVKDKTYKYSVRYVYNTRNVSNGWSKEITPAKATLTEDPILNITENDTVFTYDPRKYNILVSAACGAPALTVPEKSDWKLSMAVSSSTKSRVFNIKDAVSSGSGDSITYTVQGFLANDEIDLRTVLSSDFFNTPMKVLGYLYEYVESPSDGKYTIYHWSQIATPTNPKDTETGTAHFVQYVTDENGAYKTDPEPVTDATITIAYDYSDDNHHDYGNRSLSSYIPEPERDFGDLNLD